MLIPNLSPASFDPWSQQSPVQNQSDNTFQAVAVP